MNSIPDLAKKTSINSLLNPEASSDAFNSQIPNLTASLNNHQGQPHAQQVDVYGQPYVAPPSFNLRAASWGGPDDRRKAENGTRHYGQGMEVYGEQTTSRIARGREDGGGYALDGNLWPTQQDVVYGTSAIAPMYSDERTALSGDYPHHAYPQSYHDQSTSDAPPQSWQLSERASTRIAARGTLEEPRYHAAYYPPATSMYHAPYPQDSTQQPVPRVVQPPPPTKRRSPDEEVAPPKPKRAKSTTKTPAQPKRGYTAKKRSEAAQIAAQNAKLMPQMSYTAKPSEKGKEKASDGVSMQIVPSGPGDKVLHAELQNTRCMSTKYKSDTFPRCVACTRRWAGDTCRFQGIRFFLRDAQMNIRGVSFSETQNADLPTMKFPTEWNEPLTAANIQRTKKTIARALLPTLRQELKHLRVPIIIHRPREREVRATCDTCMTSIFSSSWLCRLCGREACAECYATVNELTGERPAANPAEQEAIQARREKHAHANPFFLQCTKRIEHQARDFSPMSRFEEKELSNAIKEMEELLKGEEGEGESVVLRGQNGASASHQSQNGHGPPSEQRHPSVPPVPHHSSLPPLPGTTAPAAVSENGSSNPSSQSTLDPGAPLPERYPPCTTSNPFIPPGLSQATLETPTYPIRRFADGVLTQETFPLIWSLGQPLIVTGLTEKFKIQWTPEYFISKYGQQGCLIIECQTEVNKRITVGEFFRGFGSYEGRTECWKLKDWPPSTDFKKAFPELYEDFANAVPVPSYVRRDGVLNIASHFPSDTVAPDLGPKMYNAMATSQAAGSKGSTRLHMDMADALNIMTYAAPATDGSPGCAAWDIYRAEDSDKLRAFLTEHFRSAAKAKEKGDAAAAAGSDKAATEKAKQRAQGTQEWAGVNDPIHAQAIYLDEELRAALYAATGVKSYRIYQRPGEAVFIPAGCAHQVANLADCVKVAVDFVSPENVERCERLTQEFREQNQRKVWKEDVLQLRTMMWFAWLSCRQQEGLESSDDSAGE
ncbi:putative clavaminate synthase-like protein [Lyophyllum shimeji]|uniref:Clavaminate synthase-like protein n=1 Tax=Lyophyllum shimeji TaxID=47721 RepID=A0A9P3PCG0_LYOSH|nr:putative clavaminate synthase-like protein [Lyophyllum shimeji]